MSLNHLINNGSSDYNQNTINVACKSLQVLDNVSGNAAVLTVGSSFSTLASETSQYIDCKSSFSVFVNGTNTLQSLPSGVLFTNRGSALCNCFYGGFQTINSATPKNLFATSGAFGSTTLLPYINQQVIAYASGKLSCVLGTTLTLPVRLGTGSFMSPGTLTITFGTTLPAADFDLRLVLSCPAFAGGFGYYNGSAVFNVSSAGVLIPNCSGSMVIQPVGTADSNVLSLTATVTGATVINVNQSSIYQT